MGVWLERATRVPRPSWRMLVILGLWTTVVVFTSSAFAGGEHAPTLCPFRRLTGVPCPGCGGTRGARAIFDGHPERAFDLNPLLFLFLTLWGALLVRRLATGTRIVVRLSARGRKVAWIVGVVLTGLGWAYVVWRQGTSWS